jgi:uncharacterized membrane protein
MAAKVIAALAAILIASTASADCRQFFVAKHHRQVAVVQQVVAPYYPPIYYAAGQDLQAEALAAKVAALVEKKLAQRQEQNTPPAPQSILAQKCAKCHSGATPKGGITLDGTTELLCRQITASIRAVSSDSMPKGGPVLTPEEKGALLEELLSLERKEGGP